MQKNISSIVTTFPCRSLFLSVLKLSKVVKPQDAVCLYCQKVQCLCPKLEKNIAAVFACIYIFVLVWIVFELCDFMVGNSFRCYYSGCLFVQLFRIVDVVGFVCKRFFANKMNTLPAVSFDLLGLL